MRGSQDVLGLVAVQSHLGAAGLGLVPGDDAPPRPAGNLQGVRGQGQLTPVRKYHQPASGARQAQGLLHPPHGPHQVGALVAGVIAKRRVVFTGAGLLVLDAWVLCPGSGREAAAGVGRIGDHGIVGCLRHRHHQGHAVPVQHGMCVGHRTRA